MILQILQREPSLEQLRAQPPPRFLSLLGLAALEVDDGVGDYCVKLSLSQRVQQFGASLRDLHHRRVQQVEASEVEVVRIGMQQVQGTLRVGGQGTLQP